MAQINFVRHRIKKLSELELKDQKIFKLVTAITGFFLVALLAVIGVRFYLLNEFKKIEADQASLRQQVKVYEEREQEFVLFVNKLKTLSQIFTKRQDKQDAISYFTGIFGPEVIIDQMAYDSTEQILAFGLNSAHIFALENVFKILNQTVEAKKFAEISRSNLSRSSEGLYRLQVTVLLTEGQEDQE